MENIILCSSQVMSCYKGYCNAFYCCDIFISLLIFFIIFIFSGANANLDPTSHLLMYLSSIDIIKTFTDYQQLVSFSPPILKPEYNLAFSSLVNQALVNHEKLKVFGSIKQNKGVLKFDGAYDHLQDTGEFTGMWYLFNYSMYSCNPQ